MASLFQSSLILAVGLAVALPGCRPRFQPDFEAVVSLDGAPGSAPASQAVLADELRERIRILAVEAEVDPGPEGDGCLTIRLKAGDRDEALAALDALSHSGDLRVRAVHDQTIYLSTAARRDPSKLPPDHQILTYTLRAGGKSRVEDLVVSTIDIITGADVKSAQPERSADRAVRISLTPSGGEKLIQATKSMQKGRSRLAIIYDGLIISAPVVGAVLSSEFVLEGFNSFPEARAVAAALHKPLSTKLLIESLKPLAP